MSPVQLGAAVVLASIGIASLAALLTPAFVRAPRPVPPHLSQPTTAEEPVRQIPITHQAAEPAKKADRVAMSPNDVPARAAPVARIAPADPPAIPRPADAVNAPAGSVGDPEPEPEPEPKRRLQRNSTDICVRTGGWRVTTKGGKSWHCHYARGR